MLSPPFPIFAQADDGIFRFLHTMKGPDFLILYLGWFILTFGWVLIMRWRGSDLPSTSITGMLAYELLGVARIIAGSAHGMHKWEFLILMMVAGGLAFFIRAQHFQRPDGEGWWNSGGSADCSGGGGCGGGGGGGGCGGCGGS